jgi:quercetin dioxygenase-like cupin family protein
MGFLRRVGARPSLLGVVALFLAAPASAQPESVTRSVIQEQPIPAPQYRAVTVKTVIAAGGETPPHTHPGVEMAYIVAGDAVLRIKGKSDWKLSGGDSFSVPRDTVHSVRNTGAGALTIVSTYIVDKDQPIVIPAR